MTFLWILLAILYVACSVYFGLATFRKGHYWTFWIGFILPILWIIGALIAPTPPPPRGRRPYAAKRHPQRPWRAHDNDDTQDQPARDTDIEKAAGCGGAAFVGGRAGRAR